MGLGLAVVIWGFVVVVSSLLDHEHQLRSLVESVEWLALPGWHFQRNDGFRMLSPLVAGFALVANLVCEELWFRGYLQDKLRFLGAPAGWAPACSSRSTTSSRRPSRTRGSSEACPRGPVEPQA